MDAINCLLRKRGDDELTYRSLVKTKGKLKLAGQVIYAKTGSTLSNVVSGARTS